jgi:hypothetical protein
MICGWRRRSKPFFVSITHLVFVGGPLARDIAAYIKHRIKRLRRLEGRPSQKKPVDNKSN